MNRRRLALIGAGQMGSSHARIIAESSIADLAVVIDIDAEAAKRVAGKYDSVPSTDLADALNCDGVVIAGSTAAPWSVCCRSWKLAFRCSLRSRLLRRLPNSISSSTPRSGATFQ